MHQLLLATKIQHPLLVLVLLLLMLPLLLLPHLLAMMLLLLLLLPVYATTMKRRSWVRLGLPKHTWRFCMTACRG